MGFILFDVLSVFFKLSSLRPFNYICTSSLVFNFPLDVPFAFIYQEHLELPLCVKWAIEINVPCLA